jgi:hypothetical protein
VSVTARRVQLLASALVVAACTPATNGISSPSPSVPDSPSSTGSVVGLYTCTLAQDSNAPLAVLELREDRTMTWTGGIPNVGRWSSDGDSGVAYGWAFTIAGDQLNFAGSGAPFDVCTPAP